LGTGKSFTTGDTGEHRVDRRFQVIQSKSHFIRTADDTEVKGIYENGLHHLDDRGERDGIGYYLLRERELWQRREWRDFFVNGLADDCESEFTDVSAGGFDFVPTGRYLE
jgi:hypothetical protein